MPLIEIVPDKFINTDRIDWVEYTSENEQDVVMIILSSGTVVKEYHSSLTDEFIDWIVQYRVKAHE